MTKIKREEQGDLEGDIQEALSIIGKKKVPTEQINRELAKLKLTYAAQIPWGELYRAVSKNSQVIEFA